MIDVSDSFAVTKIQVLDASGNVLEDNVILTDAMGNTRGGGSSPAPVAEPSSALLLAAACLGFLGYALTRVGPRVTTAIG